MPFTIQKKIASSLTRIADDKDTGFQLKNALCA
jgi:hypothetical protein